MGNRIYPRRFTQQGYHGPVNRGTAIVQHEGEGSQNHDNHQPDNRGTSYVQYLDEKSPQHDNHQLDNRGTAYVQYQNAQSPDHDNHQETIKKGVQVQDTPWQTIRTVGGVGLVVKGKSRGQQIGINRGGHHKGQNLGSPDLTQNIGSLSNHDTLFDYFNSNANLVTWVPSFK